MTVQDFDNLIRANMEAALEKTCELLPKDQALQHDMRAAVAQHILEAVQQGQHSLASLTAAGARALQQTLPD